MRASGLGVAIGGALLVGVLGVGLARSGWPGGSQQFTGTAYEPPQPATAFELIDHHGQAVTLDDFEGTALLMFFGYTHCPDVCPLTLQKLSRVLEGMGERADTSDVRVLVVTVDPARDDPAALREYVRRFGPFATGLTGDPEGLREMREAYGIFAEPRPPGHDHPAMDIGHTSQVLGIDRTGDLRVLLPTDAPDEVVASDIATLIRR